MNNRRVAMVSFWVFVAANVVSYVLAVMELVRPTTNPEVVVTLAVIIIVLGVIGWISLIVLLYSLAAMLGVFGEKAN